MKRCGMHPLGPSGADLEAGSGALSVFSSLRILRIVYCELNSRAPTRCELGSAICVCIAAVFLRVEFLRVQFAASCELSLR
eukprot:610776-Alexandrium_andersonii.AAC.1